MTHRRKKWLTVAGILLGMSAVLIIGLLVAVSALRKRFEPYIRAQAIAYLRQRFDSDVELAALHIRLPAISPVHMLMARGRGTLAQVEGSGLVLRQGNRRDIPPLLALKNFSFEVDLGTVFEVKKSVRQVVMQGLELTIPPKGERTALTAAKGHTGEPASKGSGGITIKTVLITDCRLVILPKNQAKTPLTFDISKLELKSAGNELPMQYDAVLTNPRPPGLITSTGSFGPWAADAPGDTPLKGNYIFEKADLGVFTAIAGILHSTGDFAGTLSAINAEGTATVPDFRLKRAGNPVALSVTFEVLVDGGNGNTTLQPVHAVLGSTRFTTSGAVIRKDGDSRRSILLDVNMPSGDLHDVLRLAMKGAPFMDGTIALLTKIEVPPLTGKVKEKLLLDGRFKISNGKFLRSELQSKIDALSRRGQGQPKNEEITEVFSDMKGNFRLEDQTLTFRSLTFATPGADVSLAGQYHMANGGTAEDELDFHGSLRLQARVSQTMTGWKRWALKPVDPFFAKNGAGTFLRIKIDGNSKSPNFGLDR